MGKIYCCTLQVLAWVGVAENGSDQLMDTFEEVGTEAPGWGIEAVFLTRQEMIEFLRLCRRCDPSDPRSTSLTVILEKIWTCFSDSIENATKFFQRP
jgi:hypothetical protein